jgi:hypothetical protein
MHMHPSLLYLARLFVIGSTLPRTVSRFRLRCFSGSSAEKRIKRAIGIIGKIKGYLPYGI